MPNTLLRDRNLWIVFAVTLMVVLGVASITPAFPGIVRGLGTSDEAVALVIVAFTLPGVVLSPILGVLADRLGRKQVLVPALLLFGLAGTACALAPDFRTLLALRFVQGIGAAPLGILNVTLIGDLYDGRERTLAMGYNASVLSVGTAAYPALGGALATLSWRVPFLLSLASFPIAAAVAWRLANPKVGRARRLGGYLKRVASVATRRRPLGLFTATVLTFALLYGTYMTFFPLLLEQRYEASPWLIGLVMSAMSVTTAVTAARLGPLSARFGTVRLIPLAFLVYGAALVWMPLSPAVWIVLAPTVLFGFAQGINIPSILVMLTGIAEPEQRGAVMAVNATLLRLGQTVGPIAAAAVFRWLGMSPVFWIGAAFALATALLLRAVLTDK